ncbi:MAG: flagellar filament capping protein FliD [Planctomycetota bacterium]
MLDTQSHLTTSNAEIVLNGLNDPALDERVPRRRRRSRDRRPAETSGLVTFDGRARRGRRRLEAPGLRVKAYNDVVNFVNGQSDFEDSGPSGALFGESSLRTVKNGLASTLFSSQLVDATSAFGSLGLVGIKLATDGTLSVDETKVKEKLALDAEAFRDFFVDLDGFDNGGAAEGTGEYYVDTSSDTGLFALLQKKLEALIDDKPLPSGAKAPGIIAQRKATLEANIKQFDKQIEQLEFRLEGFEQGLIAQYSALEQTMNQLNSQSSALGQLQSLNFNGNNNN